LPAIKQKGLFNFIQLKVNAKKVRGGVLVLFSIYKKWNNFWQLGRKQGKTVMFLIDCRICRKAIGMGERKKFDHSVKI